METTATYKNSWAHILGQHLPGSLTMARRVTRARIGAGSSIGAVSLNGFGTRGSNSAFSPDVRRELDKFGA